MIKKIFFGIGLAVVLGIVGLVNFAGGKSYNTDFVPPSGLNEQTWPELIGGMPRQLQKLDFANGSVKGGVARYGQGAAIVIVSAADQAALDAFVETSVRPDLEIYGSKSSGKLNGAWWVKATGNPGRLYAWQKQNWFYSVQTANDDLFDEAVKKFAFIASE
ncbi:hypothetical protein WNZ14_21300 [Hoeflea sp. AS60]|uniref:hypothetical protein n=1 Tax=Hoeflea sp. AS60 TaxID=3135780 RepID=UPI003179B83E